AAPPGRARHPPWAADCRTGPRTRPSTARARGWPRPHGASGTACWFPPSGPRRVSPGDRPLAGLAESVQLHLVRGDLEPVLARHLVLERRDAVVLELDDGAAAGTDEVVVVVPAHRRLVAGLPVPEVPRVGEAALVQQLHRPVDRCHRDPIVLLAHLRPELLHRLMAAEGEEGVDDQAPLPRGLQAVLGHVATEKLGSVRLAHG